MSSKATVIDWDRTSNTCMYYEQNMCKWFDFRYQKQYVKRERERERERERDFRKLPVYSLQSYNMFTPMKQEIKIGVIYEDRLEFCDKIFCFGHSCFDARCCSLFTIINICHAK